MNANELRIGSWLLDGVAKKHYQIDGADIITISRIPLLGAEEKIKKRHLESLYQPIPLSPEVLEKAGFNDSGESVGSNWYYKLINIPSNHMNPTYELNLFTTEEKNKYGINLEEQYFGYCKHLHQLQNLYFALTGEELTYTP